MTETPLYEQTAAIIESRITSEEYENGARIPSEQQLGEELGVSRTIIREALKLLKERGLIETRTGSGAYVTKPEARNISEVVSRIVSLDGIDYKDVFDVRTILECEAASLAAKNATEEQISEMQKQLDILSDFSLSHEARAEEDFRYHFLVAKASGNTLLAILAEAIGDVCRNTIVKTNQLMGSAEDSIVRHAHILESIAAGDSAGARNAAKDHLDESKRRYIEYISQKNE